MRQWIFGIAVGLIGLGCSTDAVTFPSGAGGAASNSGSGGNGSANGGGSNVGGAGQGGMGSSSGGNGGAGAATPANNGFPEVWINGTACGMEPSYQLWEYAEDTFILRQSLCTDYEGPFIYIMLGNSAALVQDTGTGDVNLYTPIAKIVTDWSSKRGLGTLPIYVTHSHAHGDHVGGDSQFQGKPNVTVVGSNQSSVANFFGFSNWPQEPVTFDLGGRVLDVLAIPGHQSAHVALYDRRHRLLLTGDTLYPGRLYINNWPQYQASTQRLVDFGNANPITWVLGTHIEMRATGGDFPFASTSHPDEHVLQLPFGVLQELNTSVQAMGNNPVQQEHADFIIYP